MLPKAPQFATSLLLLFTLVGCANGSTSSFTQAPIFFNDGASDQGLAFDEAAPGYVAAQGTAILPLDPAQQAGVDVASAQVLGAALPSSAVTGAAGPRFNIEGGAPVAIGSIGVNPGVNLNLAPGQATAGANLSALGAPAVGAGAGVAATGGLPNVSAGLSAPAVGASAAIATTPASLTLNAPVLGTATINTAALAAPSAISSALVTTSLGGQNVQACLPSLRRRC